MAKRMIYLDDPKNHQKVGRNCRATKEMYATMVSPRSHKTRNYLNSLQRSGIAATLIGVDAKGKS